MFMSMLINIYVDFHLPAPPPRTPSPRKVDDFSCIATTSPGLDTLVDRLLEAVDEPSLGNWYSHVLEVSC